MGKPAPDTQVIDLIRDEFKTVHSRMDEHFDQFSKHMEKDEKAWEKLENVIKETHTLRALLHTIWIGGTTIGTLFTAWKWKS